MLNSPKSYHAKNKSQQQGTGSLINLPQPAGWRNPLGAAQGRYQPTSPPDIGLSPTSFIFAKKTMIIDNFEPFNGQHCETTATGSLLKQLGIEYSESMLFGVGQGLGFIFWKMKSMDSPFLGGRIKTDLLTENICKNLNLELEVKTTSSQKKAWENVQSKLLQNQAVGLKLDCYHLEYFSSKIHFAGHYVAMYGYDSEYAYVVDTAQQHGLVKTSLASLTLARNEKGPMSSHNLSYTITRSGKSVDLKSVILKAIKNNADDYLNPPIKNMGYKGILKTSAEIKKWFKESKNRKEEFQLTAMLMERAGTGGSLFRNLYRDFLKESYELLNIKSLDRAYREFIAIAAYWKQVAELLHEAGETSDEKCIEQASLLLRKIAGLENETMESLKNIYALQNP